MKVIQSLKAIFIVILILTCSFKSLAVDNKLPQLGKSSLKKVISAMTLEEKASLVCGTGMDISKEIMKYLGPMASRMIPKEGSLASMTKKPVKGVAGTTVEIPRLGITSVVFSDGPAGVRMSDYKYNCTAFPISSLIASTWDTDLIEKAGQAYGNETKEYGIDVLLAPALNIQRNPLCGRDFEYYSEDPFLSGKMAAAMVRGIQSQGVGTSIKHFVANNAETNRKNSNSIISERALREIYLEGFRIAVEESKPWTLMTSYNLMNGKYTSENYNLLVNVLRKEWGYKGMVTSDWDSGNDIIAQMKAGNNLLMPGPFQTDTIIKAVKEGKLDEKILDQNVEDILKLVLKTPRFKRFQYTDQPNSKENENMARIVATQGMVLLKNNDNSLPISKNAKKIALFGNESYTTLIGGEGSGSTKTQFRVNFYEGLRNLSYTPDSTLKKTYLKYLDGILPKSQAMIDITLGNIIPSKEMALDSTMVEQLANRDDVAILTIGRISGEGKDRKVDNDFNLTKKEKANIALVSRMFHAKGKKLIVVLNIGGVIETESWKGLADAILLAWQPGIEAGNAIADVVTGKVNPSGKLPVTFPISYDDVPSSKNFPGDKVLDDSIIKRNVVYSEGIYVGYRYYNTFNVKTSYPFGFGLSYTKFQYDHLKLSSNNFEKALNVKVRITNTGKVSGKEVVQLYLRAPHKEIDKPSEELKGFAKTKLLKPGESQIISFHINARSLASFEPRRSAWIAEAGNYEVRLGSSSEDIKLTKIFQLKKELNVEKVKAILEPQINIKELKSARN